MFESAVVNGNIQAQAISDPLVNKTTVARDDFLKLLIAQMSNQDPLSPVDNQDFAAQLAQFSSLEQLQSINSNIEYGVEMDLILTRAINNTLAATIIGKEAKALGDAVVYDASGSAEISFKLDASAKDVEITITDEAGVTMRVLRVEGLIEGEHTLSWDGKNENGRTVSQGTYHFSVSATDANSNEIMVTPIMQGTITGVRYENGNAVLMIGGAEVSFASILEIGVEDNS